MGFLGSFVAPEARLFEPQKCSKDTIYSSCLWQHNKPNFVFYKWWFLLVTNIFFFFFWVPPTPYPFLFFLLTHLKKQYWFLKLIDLSLNAFILKYEISDKNWETWKRLLCFWSIFWLFFLSSKVSKMKFNQKSLIYKNTTLYDIDFYQKIRILRFFLRKFLLTVFRIFH